MKSRVLCQCQAVVSISANAQAVVAADSLLVVATDVVQAANDKQQLEPMLNKVVALPDALGKAETLLADNGYFSAANVAACAETGIVPLLSLIHISEPTRLGM